MTYAFHITTDQTGREVSKRPQLHQCQSTSTRRKIDNGKLDLKRSLSWGQQDDPMPKGCPVTFGVESSMTKVVTQYLYLSIPLSVRLSVDLFVFLFACLFAASPGAAKVSSYSPNFRLHAQRVITVYLSCFYLCLCLCLLPVWATLSAKLASSCRHRHIDWLSFLAFIISAKGKSNKTKKTRKNEKN